MMKSQLAKKMRTLKNTALLPIAILLFMLFCNMKVVSTTDLKYALIANESFPTLSKFELNLYSGHLDLARATESIWLSVRGTNINDLSNGKYVFSQKNANTRAASTFLGCRSTAGEKKSITDGSFTVIKDKDRLIVDYDFTLEDGTKIIGTYNGKYETVDLRAKLR